MSVVIETTIGDITIDLFTDERPRTCMNFLKLCKMKYYNLNLLFSIERNFIVQTGDPTANGRGGGSVFQKMFGDQARFYEGEKLPIMKHTQLGTLSMVSCGNHLFGSQFFITLGENLDSLDAEHLVFGQVVEGMAVINKLNQTLTDSNNRPYQDIRISHMVVLDDPYPDPEELEFPDESPRPTREMFESDYIAADENIDDTEGKSMAEIQEEIAEREAKARATILEMVGDLPDSDMAPPENVLFICKLNPVTTSEDLEIIFSRFGKIKSCEVIRDKVTNNSLQYGFIEFAETKSCEDAYFKMDNVLIDDRRVHVDFSQSVSKLKWRGKGKGVDFFDDSGKKVNKKSQVYNPNEDHNNRAKGTDGKSERNRPWMRDSGASNGNIRATNRDSKMWGKESRPLPQQQQWERNGNPRSMESKGEMQFSRGDKRERDNKELSDAPKSIEKDSKAFARKRSHSSSDDSDDELPSDDEARKKMRKHLKKSLKKKKKKKHKKHSTKSDSDSSDGEKKKKNKKNKKKKKKKASSSDSDSDSDSEPRKKSKKSKKKKKKKKKNDSSSDSSD